LYPLLCFTLLFPCPAKPPSLFSSLSLHDALPISVRLACLAARSRYESSAPAKPSITTSGPKSAGESALFSFFESGCWKSSWIVRSEEHTSELQSRGHLVCRLLLEKKKEVLTSRVR